MRSLTTLLVLAVALPALAQHQARPSRHRQLHQGRRGRRLRRRDRDDGPRWPRQGRASRPSSTCAWPTEAGANIEANAAHAKSLGLNYINIPFNGAAARSQGRRHFLATIANKANQPVFVHCGSASRVGGMWLVKRVLQDGWAVDKATEEAKLIGLRSEPLEKFALIVHRNPQEVECLARAPTETQNVF